MLVAVLSSVAGGLWHCGPALCVEHANGAPPYGGALFSSAIRSVSNRHTLVLAGDRARPEVGRLELERRRGHVPRLPGAGPGSRGVRRAVEPVFRPMQPVTDTKYDATGRETAVVVAVRRLLVVEAALVPGAGAAGPADRVAEVEVPDLVRVGDVVAVRRPRDAGVLARVEYIGWNEYGTGLHVAAARVRTARARTRSLALASAAPTLPEVRSLTWSLNPAGVSFILIVSLSPLFMNRLFDVRRAGRRPSRRRSPRGR